MPTNPQPLDIETVYAGALAWLPYEPSFEERQKLQADLQLQLDYPATYVVYIDEWQGETPQRQLSRRVIAYSRSDDDLQSVLAQYPAGEAMLRYVEDPNDDSLDILPEEVE